MESRKWVDEFDDNRDAFLQNSMDNTINGFLYILEKAHLGTFIV